MAAAAEIQSGAKGYINGIPGAFTVSYSSGPAVVLGQHTTGATFAEEWKETEITSQNGAVVAGLIASHRRRKLTLKFFPAAATKLLAQSAAIAMFTWNPNEVITLADMTITALNGTYNLKPGMTLEMSNEAVAVANINLEQYEVEGTSDTFAALALVS